LSSLLVSPSPSPISSDSSTSTPGLNGSNHISRVKFRSPKIRGLISSSFFLLVIYFSVFFLFLDLLTTDENTGKDPRLQYLSNTCSLKQISKTTPYSSSSSSLVPSLPISSPQNPPLIINSSQSYSPFLNVVSNNINSNADGKELSLFSTHPLLLFGDDKHFHLSPIPPPIDLSNALPPPVSEQESGISSPSQQEESILLPSVQNNNKISPFVQNKQNTTLLSIEQNNIYSSTIPDQNQFNYSLQDENQHQTFSLQENTSILLSKEQNLNDKFKVEEFKDKIIEKVES
jgi:hypothetical protein